MSHIIDGKALAAQIRADLKDEVLDLKRKGIVPGLAVVLVGDDPASHIYVKNKKIACKKIGIEEFSHTLPAETTEDALLKLIDELNADQGIHGILVQLPLPDHIDESKVLNRIIPEKDADGFHPINIGKLVLGEPCPKPCTPAGILALLDHANIDLKGKHAVVVGRSNIVGKPVSMMLLERHATVTICHSRTENLPDEIARADILVAAVGRPKLIQGSWIKPGAAVIDVGTNRTSDGKLVGDVEFDEAKLKVSAITPVPGGVGPMTIAMLMKNTVEAAKKLLK